MKNAGFPACSQHFPLHWLKKTFMYNGAKIIWYVKRIECFAKVMNNQICLQNDSGLIVTFLFNNFFFIKFCILIRIFKMQCELHMIKLESFFMHPLTQPLILHVTRLKYSGVHVIS